jgi:hypothetical protein
MTRGSSRSKPPAAWAIDIAANMMADAASDVNSSECEPALVEAVLADRYRDEGVVPLAPDVFAAVTAGLDDADWQRLAVVVGMFADSSLRAALAGVSGRMPVREQIEKGMVAPARALRAVDLRILESSMVRAEEMARRVAFGLGIAFEGETEAQSSARLAKIDYTRLLSKVDAAKTSAEQQMAELLRQQEAEDNRIARSRRGKW